MPDEPEVEAVKKFELELDAFGKRNKPKFSLIGDLSLCLRTCKTPEVRASLSEMTKKAMAEIEKDMASTEQKIQKQMEAAAKKAEKANKSKGGKGGKPTDSAGKQKQTKMKLKVSLDKFSKKYLPSDKTLFLELAAKPKNEPPFVDYKKSIFSVGLKF